MGHKTYLTVRKCRCNERQEIYKRKKRLCERPPVLRMYGITEKQPTTSDNVQANIKPISVASTGSYCTRKH